MPDGDAPSGIYDSLTRERYPDTAAIELHWIIVGGESGSNARPMHPDWARALRDQAQAAGASFFFKQWGEDIPKGQQMADGMESLLYAAGSEAFGGKAPRRPAEGDDRNWAYRVGKARAGRLLDGREWNEVPA